MTPPIGGPWQMRQPETVRERAKLLTRNRSLAQRNHVADNGGARHRMNNRIVAARFVERKIREGLR